MKDLVRVEETRRNRQKTQSGVGVIYVNKAGG